MERSVIAPARFVALSDSAWLLRNEEGAPLILAGVFALSFVGTKPELWLIKTKEFERHYARYVRQLVNLFLHLRDLYPMLQVKVRDDFLVGSRFAERFGFLPVREEALPQGNFMVLECR